MKPVRLLVFLICILRGITPVPEISGQIDERPIIPLMPEQIADSLRRDMPPDSVFIHRSTIFFQKELARFSLPDHPIADGDIDSVVSRIESTGRYWIAYLGAYLGHSQDHFTHLEFIGGLRAFELWLLEQGCVSRARIRELVRQENGTLTMKPEAPSLLHLQVGLLLKGERRISRNVELKLPYSFSPNS